MAYEPDEVVEEEVETLTIPDFGFDGKPGDMLKFVARGKDGSLQFQRVTEEAVEEPDEKDEDLTTVLRRDMAAIPPEGEM